MPALAEAPLDRPVTILCACADANVKRSCDANRLALKEQGYKASIVCLTEAKEMSSAELPSNAIVILDTHGDDDGTILDNHGTKLTPDEQRKLIGNRAVAVLTCYSDKNSNANICYVSGAGPQPMHAAGAAFRHCLQHGPASLEDFRPTLEEGFRYRHVECESESEYQKLVDSCRKRYAEEKGVIDTKVKKAPVLHCSVENDCPPPALSMTVDSKEEFTEYVTEMLNLINMHRRPENWCRTTGEVKCRPGTSCSCFTLHEPVNLCPRFPGTWPFAVPTSPAPVIPPAPPGRVPPTAPSKMGH